MRLTEIPEAITGIEVVRDAEFQGLGFVGSGRDGTLAPIHDSRFMPSSGEGFITAVITSPDLARHVPEPLGVIVSTDPQTSFYQLHIQLLKAGGFYPDNGPTKVDPTAIIHPTAVISELGVEIGPDSTIGPGVVIHEGTSLGGRVVVRANTVIGTEGFEVRTVGGTWMTVPHAGGVRIADDVELQAGVTVSRGLFDDTEIGEGTKADNLVHIAHGARIGRRCRFAAAAMVAGSVVIGDEVFVGPNASISSSVRIGDRAHITIGAVVTRDVQADKRVSGNFAIDHDRLIEHLREIR